MIGLDPGDTELLDRVAVGIARQVGGAFGDLNQLSIFDLLRIAKELHRYNQEEKELLEAEQAKAQAKAKAARASGRR